MKGLTAGQEHSQSQTSDLIPSQIFFPELIAKK